MDSLVVLSFHPAFYPPKSGGELRLYHICKGLSEKYRIVLVTFTFPGTKNAEVVEHAANFMEIRIPKTWISTTLHHIMDRFSGIKECSAVVTSIESRFNRDFRRVVDEHSGDARALIFVSPFLFTLPGRILQGKKVVYEAYNVEYDLMRPSFSRSLLGRAMLSYVFNVERSAARKSDLIFAVSREDGSGIARLYGVSPDKIRLSYNGIALNGAVTEKKAPVPEHPVCVFIGSIHPPNINAANRVIEIADRMPEAMFLIAGGVARGLASGGQKVMDVPDGVGHISWTRLSKNVLLASEINDEEKDAIYQASDIALNPMLDGSGTNIKMLDYMAAGLPIVTTPMGARGLDLEAGRHAMICDVAEFPSRIRQLSADKDMYFALRGGGRRLVEERYDWKTISGKMIADLEALLHA